MPVFVDNDATVAALAEAHDDQLQMVARDLVMLTVGTGVGGGLVLGGRIYRGATGGAGELGHTIVGMDMTGACPPAGRFPQPGSLEAEAAGHAFDRLAADYARRAPGVGARTPARGRRAARRRRCGRRPPTTATPTRARMVEIWGERVGIGIANAINTFDPEEVVIGGGAARAGELLLAPARRTAAGYVLPGSARAPRSGCAARRPRRRARRGAAGGVRARGRFAARAGAGAVVR